MLSARELAASIAKGTIGARAAVEACVKRIEEVNPALNAVVGNWEIGGIITLHTGNALTLNNFGGWGVGGARA